MALHPSSNRLERVLIFGESGSGKSSTWVSVADWIDKTKSGSVIYAMDTDNAWDGMRPEDGSLDNVVKVSPLSSSRYSDWRPAVRAIRDKVKRDDWVVLDMADKAWLGAQNAYWQAKQGDSFADAFAAAVIADDLGELSGHHGTNWGAINMLYNDFMEPFINMPCNVIGVTGSKGLQTERVAGQVRVKSDDAEWAKFGCKPAGQGGLKGAFHTVIYAQELPGDKWSYTTAKERGPIGRVKRPYLKGEKVDDFVRTYLFKVANWKP